MTLSSTEYPASPYLRKRICWACTRKGADYPPGGLSAGDIANLRCRAFAAPIPFGRIPILEHGRFSAFYETQAHPSLTLDAALPGVALQATGGSRPSARDEPDCRHKSTGNVFPSISVGITAERFMSQKFLESRLRDEANIAQAAGRAPRHLFYRSWRRVLQGSAEFLAGDTLFHPPTSWSHRTCKFFRGYARGPKALMQGTALD